MGAVWHPKAIRRTHIDAGAFQGGGRKLVWHTTEGTSLPNYGGSAPHFTLDPADGRLWQHIPLDRAARALMAGGPNFFNTVQVEVIGFADTAQANKVGAPERAVVNWPESHYVMGAVPHRPRARLPAPRRDHRRPRPPVRRRQGSQAGDDRAGQGDAPHPARRGARGRAGGADVGLEADRLGRAQAGRGAVGGVPARPAARSSGACASCPPSASAPARAPVTPPGARWRRPNGWRSRTAPSHRRTCSGSSGAAERAGDDLTEEQRSGSSFANALDRIRARVGTGTPGASVSNPLVMARAKQEQAIRDLKSGSRR